jgi:hypothetical protein
LCLSNFLLLLHSPCTAEERLVCVLLASFCCPSFMLLLYFPCTAEEMLVYCVACFFLLSKFYASAVLSMYFRRNASFVCCFLLSACSSSMCNFLPYSLKKSLRL